MSEMDWQELDWGESRHKPLSTFQALLSEDVRGLSQKKGDAIFGLFCDPVWEWSKEHEGPA